ncbi:hypothetical protein BCR43DRAFT_523317 [Syncephalastrum racemosum]|uniref:SWI5-dependent HO expression protein 3 n=1 Tax=Syncephalastrum racemosum TaxID=13706 RepID=A0A1X2HJT5_SYNRA|nr:hypothetical protein BCR43DRAFT_523317 [Syncephalastrum racemosum]
MPSHEELVSRINYGHLFRFDDQPNVPLQPSASRDLLPSLQAKLDALDRQKTALTLEIDTVRKSREAHLQELETMRQENDGLRKNHGEILKEIDRKQAVVEALKKANTDAEAQVKVQKEAAAEQSKKAKDMMERSELRKEVERAEARAQQSLAQTEALKATRDSLDRQHAQQMKLYQSLLELLQQTATRLMDQSQQKTDALDRALYQIKQDRMQSLEALKVNQSNEPQWVEELSKLEARLQDHLEMESKLTTTVTDCQDQLQSLVKRIKQVSSSSQ